MEYSNEYDQSIQSYINHSRDETKHFNTVIDDRVYWEYTK